jgi:hypothetical protein
MDEKQLDDIKDLMVNGNWTTAIEKYKKLTCTPQQFVNYLEDQFSFTVEDFALLGFYAKTEI